MSIKPNKLIGFGGYLSKLSNLKSTIGNIAKPTQLQIEGEDNIEFTHISSGSYHGQIGYKSTKGSQLFTFGSNTSGQLGLGSMGQEYHAGKVHSLPPVSNILSLSSGREHSAALIQDNQRKNRLFTTGNTMLGQLGLGMSKNYSKDLDANNNFQCVDQFTEVMTNLEVKDVQCGLDHTVLLSDQGDIYTSGWGSDGQLGLGPNHSADVDKFHKVTIPNNQKVIKFTVRHDCTIILTDQGNLYSWGNSEYGQACHGRKIDRVLEPLQFQFDHSIKDVKTGGNFTLLLTDNNEAFVCGCGSLGLGESQKEALTPTKIHSVQNISQIFAGGNSAALLDNNNELYTFGIGSPLFSRLGFSHHQSVFEATKLDIDSKSTITNVEMGWQFGLIIVQD